MSSPRPIVLLLIVVAIVLIGVYLLGLGLGSGRQRPRMGDVQAFFAELGFGAPSRVTCADLAARAPEGSKLPRCGCDATDRIPVSPAGCTAALDSTLPWRRRTLVPSSDQHGAVKVTVSSEDGKTVVRGDLGEPSEFPVPPGGATLSLACALPSCTAIIRR